MTGSTFGLSKIVFYSSNFFCFFIKLTKLFLSDVTFSSVFRTVQVNKCKEQFTVHTQKKRERHWKDRVSHDSFRDISIQWMVPIQRGRERDLQSCVGREKNPSKLIALNFTIKWIKTPNGTHCGISWGRNCKCAVN